MGGSPFNPGRDSNAAAGMGFGDGSDVADEHLNAFQSSFHPPSDQLSEQDYRDGDNNAGGAPTDRVSVPHDRTFAGTPQKFTYPTPQAGGGYGPMSK
jgi:hypothetical protein